MAANLVDVRAINKPWKFKGDNAQWSDWRFVTENYLLCVSVELATGLQEAATMAAPVLWEDLIAIMQS
jgi:hypothetical protein